ncbi:MAG: rhodanese-like domain-containing protein [Candidatus Sungbacteria bacterium]|nr:rhodanese-like domain-containing protein [Candidatus Sungbacteria bacterium]
MEQPKTISRESLGFFIAGILLAAVAIYLTPLKHVNVVPPTVKKVKAADFYADFTKNPDKYILVDIRPQFLRFEYPENSVVKTIFNLSEDAKTLPKRGKTIVIFCEENVSETVAYGYLESQGFTNVKIIDGGRTAWKEAGLPLVKNANYNEEARPFLYFFEEGGLLPKAK